MVLRSVVLLLNYLGSDFLQVGERRDCIRLRTPFPRIDVPILEIEREPAGSAGRGAMNCRD